MCVHHSFAKKVCSSDQTYFIIVDTFKDFALTFCNLFSHVKLSLYSQSEWRKALSRVEVQPINDSIKASPSQSQPCIVYIQIAFQMWPLFSYATSKFLIFTAKMAKAEESSGLVSVGRSL